MPAIRLLIKKISKNFMYHFADAGYTIFVPEQNYFINKRYLLL